MPSQYIDKSLDADSRDVTCYVKEHDNPCTQWRIYFSDSMLLKYVAWFHQTLEHLASSRLHKTMSQRFDNSRLRHTIDTFKCGYCQKHKLPGKGYDLLPDRDAVSQPWEEIAVDLIGPLASGAPQPLPVHCSSRPARAARPAPLRPPRVVPPCPVPSRSVLSLTRPLSC